MVVVGGNGVRMCYVGLTAVFSKALEKQPLDKSFLQIPHSLPSHLWKRDILSRVHLVFSSHGVYAINMSIVYISL